MKFYIKNNVVSTKYDFFDKINIKLFKIMIKLFKFKFLDYLSEYLKIALLELEFKENAIKINNSIKKSTFYKDEYGVKYLEKELKDYNMNNILTICKIKNYFFDLYYLVNKM